MNTKVNAYLGFAIKSRSVVYGTNNMQNNKNLFLIVLSDCLAEGTIKKLQNKHKNCVILPQNTYNQLNIQANAFAITDKNLATEIQKYII